VAKYLADEGQRLHGVNACRLECGGHLVDGVRTLTHDRGEHTLCHCRWRRIVYLEQRLPVRYGRLALLQALHHRLSVPSVVNVPTRHVGSVHWPTYRHEAYVAHGGLDRIHDRAGLGQQQRIDGVVALPQGGHITQGAQQPRP
jgi:hypothetical protein